MNTVLPTIEELRHDLLNECDRVIHTLNIGNIVEIDAFSISAINRHSDREAWQIIQIPTFLELRGKLVPCNKSFKFRAYDGTTCNLHKDRAIWLLFKGDITILPKDRVVI